MDDYILALQATHSNILAHYIFLKKFSAVM